MALHNSIVRMSFVIHHDRFFSKKLSLSTPWTISCFTRKMRIVHRHTTKTGISTEISRERGIIMALKNRYVVYPWVERMVEQASSHRQVTGCVLYDGIQQSADRFIISLTSERSTRIPPGGPTLPHQPSNCHFPCASGQMQLLANEVIGFWPLIQKQLKISEMLRLFVGHQVLHSPEN